MQARYQATLRPANRLLWIPAYQLRQIFQTYDHWTNEAYIYHPRIVTRIFNRPYHKLRRQ